jgi:hypothetical protein
MAAELQYFKNIALPRSALAVESRRHWTGAPPTDDSVIIVAVVTIVQRQP